MTVVIQPSDLAKVRQYLDKEGAVENPKRADGQRTFPNSGVVVETGYTHGEVWFHIKDKTGVVKKFYAATHQTIEDALAHILTVRELGGEKL